MTPIRKQLLDMIVEPDAYNRPPGELLPLQLAAARELVEERRSQISVLRRRAEEAGVGEIHSLADLVPLLFAHSVYKSYPAAFIEQGRWDRMLQWLQTLSVAKVTNTDVAGVRDVDEWIARLGAAGHKILATSGTTGKCSFLNATESDYRLKVRHFAHTLGWPVLKPNRDRVVFQLFPHFGPNSGVEAANIGAEVWGRPGATYFLTDEPLRIVDVSAMAAMRKRMAEGSATPGEIAAFEAHSAERAARARGSLNGLIDKILESRHEPMVMTGMWAQHLAIIERARELGVPDGDFHPESYDLGGRRGQACGIAGRLQSPRGAILRQRASRRRLRHDRAGASDAGLHRAALPLPAGADHVDSRWSRRKAAQPAGQRRRRGGRPLRLSRSAVRRPLGRTDLGRSRDR